MEKCLKQYVFRFPSQWSAKKFLLCTLIFGLSPAPLFPQKSKGGGTTTPSPSVLTPTTPPLNSPLPNDDRVVVNRGETPSGADNKTCSLQPFPGIADTASVTSLQVPAKAQKEYAKACAALKDNKLPETEQHLRKATEIYPSYAAGWVMLGQILGTQKEMAKGREACSRASTADPKYLPAYLCLAEIAGREQKWNEVLDLSSRVLELDPAGDAYGYFFSAIAYFNLNQLPDAEVRALKAEEIDREHRQPLIRFLLAQIYEAKHDSANAASSLQEYRNLVAESQNTINAKKNSGRAQNPK